MALICISTNLLNALVPKNDSICKSSEEILQTPVLTLIKSEYNERHALVVFQNFPMIPKLTLGATGLL